MKLDLFVDSILYTMQWRGVSASTAIMQALHRLSVSLPEHDVIVGIVRLLTHPEKQDVMPDRQSIIEWARECLVINDDQRIVGFTQ